MSPLPLALVLVLIAAPAAPAQRLSIGVAAGDLRTTTLANPAGETVDIPRYGRQEIVIDGAYSVTDRLAALASLVVHRRAAIDRFGAASGIGDLRLGLHRQFGQVGGWVLGGRGIVQIPTGDPTKGGAILPTGTGAWEGEGVVSVSRALGDRWIGTFEIGHHVRGRGLRDGVIYGGRIGVRASDRVTVSWVVRGLQVYERQPGPASIASASGLGDGVAYTTFGPSTSVRVATGLAVHLGVNGAAHARNFATGVGAWAGATLTR
jgi:hypothetical protein